MKRQRAFIHEYVCGYQQVAEEEIVQALHQKLVM